MATIYSQKLASGGVTVGVVTAVYTAPAAGTVIIRDMQLSPQGDGPSKLVAYVGYPSQLMGVAGGAAYVSVAWEGRVVLDPGDVVSLYGEDVGWEYYISGYVLLN
uniref:Uncharacterized protein n=1 Tax=uncultured prokaryote TaxID=198431 RepID=A0A0H5Q259_9ZZZZ|nr:hypothetical protein [uncultured prokaryote]